MRLPKFLSTLALTLLYASVATAWDSVGHSTIACIAERHLTPETKSRCEAYLHHTLPFHASWMDIWRNHKDYRFTTHWHSTPIGADMQCVPGDMESAAIQVVEAWKRIRNYRELTDSVVELNLKFLIHLVGDMHCPCHTKYMENEELVWQMVRWRGKRDSAHHVWDASIEICHPKQYADDIAGKIDSYTDKEIEEFCKGTPTEWAHESAVDMKRAVLLLQKDEDTDNLTDEQQQVMTEIADLQAARAGYRLAYILNSIFGEK